MESGFCANAAAVFVFFGISKLGWRDCETSEAEVLSIVYFVLVNI